MEFDKITIFHADSDFLLSEEELSSIDRDCAIDHIENIRKEIQDRIKSHSSSNNVFFIQFLVIIGALIGLVLTNVDKPDLVSWTLLCLPLPVILFTFEVMTNRAYSLHYSNYLRNVLEPNYEKLSGYPRRLEWSNYRILKVNYSFDLWLLCLLVTMWSTSVFIPYFVFLANSSGSILYYLSGLAFVGYVLFAFAVSKLFTEITPTDPKYSTYKKNIRKT